MPDASCCSGDARRGGERELSQGLRRRPTAGDATTRFNRAGFLVMVIRASAVAELPDDVWSVGAIRVSTFVRLLDVEMRDDYDWLSAAERSRAVSFRNVRDRQRWLQSRRFLRAILAKALACSPDEIVFQASPGGKPTLAGDFAGRLHFSVSHSADVVAVAVSAEASVGVDIEAVTSLPELPEMAAAVCLPERHPQSEERTPNAIVAEFYRCWTFKEAVLKSVGWGLMHPMTRLPCAPVDDRALTVQLQSVRDGSKGRVVARSLPSADSLCLAIAFAQVLPTAAGIAVN